MKYEKYYLYFKQHKKEFKSINKVMADFQV